MIFIVGTGRSGTNLLRMMLNGHPEVCIATETHFIRTLLRKFGDEQFDVGSFLEVALNHWTTDGSERWVHKHLEAGGRRKAEFENSFVEFCQTQHGTVRQFVDAFFRYCYGPDHTRIGDKTPFYGRHMNALHQHWPGAKFIHMVRDGRHVAPSMQKHGGFVRLINAGFPDVVECYSYDKRADSFSTEPVAVEDCIRFWERIATDIRRESERIPDDAYLDVRYEDLVLHPLWEITRITRFLDLPVSPSHLGRAARIPRPFALSSKLDGHDPVRYNSLTSEAKNGLRRFGYSTRPHNEQLRRQTLRRSKEILVAAQQVVSLSV